MTAPEPEEARIAKLVDEAPPLTDAQVARLQAIFRRGSRAAGTTSSRDPDGLGPDPAAEEDGLNWNRPEGEEKAYADAWDALVADAGDATAADPEAEGSSSGVTIYGVAATVPGGDTTVTLQAVTYSDGSLSLWIDRPGEARAVCSLELSRPQAAALRLLLRVTDEETPVWGQE